MRFVSRRRSGPRTKIRVKGFFSFPKGIWIGNPLITQFICYMEHIWPINPSPWEGMLEEDSSGIQVDTVPILYYSLSHIMRGWNLKEGFAL